MRKVFGIGVIVMAALSIALLITSLILYFNGYEDMAEQFKQASLIPLLIGIGTFLPLPFVKEE